MRERGGAGAASAYAITQFEILPIKPAAPVAPIHKEGVARTLKKLQAGEAVKIAIMGASIEVALRRTPGGTRRSSLRTRIWRIAGG